MAVLTSPAQFGRALNFGSVHPLPMWTKSGDTEYQFSNALGWMQFLQGEIPYQVVYGAPFLDMSMEFPQVIDRFHKMIRYVVCRLPKTRIDLDGES